MVDISIVFARYTHGPCTRAIRRDFSSHLGNWICGLHLEIASCAPRGILPILSRWLRIDLSNVSRFDELNEDCFLETRGLVFSFRAFLLLEEERSRSKIDLRRRLIDSTSCAA